MPRIAFHAPMKPPDDPVPSGDRTVARSLMAALGGIGAVELASRFRSRDGVGDEAAQDRLFEQAAAEIDRLSAGGRPDLWLTYHSYYKAPDLIGPTLARHWKIPYVLVEATRAKKRLTGPHARFAAAAEAACDAADLILYMTERDGEALFRDRKGEQGLVHLRPFLGIDALAAYAPRPPHGGLNLVACGMFRSGDKLASYAALARALHLCEFPDWSLTIIGDGPEREKAHQLFRPFAEKAIFSGALSGGQLESHFRTADLLVWPGVGEAFGMVYLEAQAQGCPVLAEDRPGVRDVVRDGGWRTAEGDPAAYAAMLDSLGGEPFLLRETGLRARRRVQTDHLLGSARATLSTALAPLLAAR